MLAVRNVPGLDELVSKLYFLRLGERIGRMDHGTFEPNWILGKNRRLENVPAFELSDEAQLHRYLSGFELSMGEAFSDGGFRAKASAAPEGRGPAENGMPPSENAGPSFSGANLVQVVFENRFL